MPFSKAINLLDEAIEMARDLVSAKELPFRYDCPFPPCEASFSCEDRKAASEMLEAHLDRMHSDVLHLQGHLN